VISVIISMDLVIMLIRHFGEDFQLLRRFLIVM